MRERDKNLDLIRAFALLLVLCTHFLDNTGLYGEPFALPVRYAAGALRLMAGCCVPLFLMLTGYLHDGRRLSRGYYLGYLRIYICYLLCCALTFLIRRTVQHEPTGLAYMLGSTINFYGCYYAWYLMMYTGLFLMIPFLNLAFDGLETKQARLVLIGSFFYLSILPTMLNTHIQLLSVWWKNLYPITYYYLGLYLRRYRPHVPARRAALALLLAAAVFLALEPLIPGPAAEHGIGFRGYDHFEICVLSLIVFVLLLNIRTDCVPRPLLSLAERISRLTLPAFLMSGIVDLIVYPKLVQARPVSGSTLLLFLPVVLMNGTLALLLALPVSRASAALDRAARGWLIRRIPALAEEERERAARRGKTNTS